MTKTVAVLGSTGSIGTQTLDVVRANNVPDVLSEHREILRVIREKDLDAIEPLIRRHLYGGLRRMGTQLYAEKYRPYFTGI